MCVRFQVIPGIDVALVPREGAVEGDLRVVARLWRVNEACDALLEDVRLCDDWPLLGFAARGARGVGYLLLERGEGVLGVVCEAVPDEIRGDACFGDLGGLGALVDDGGGQTLGSLLEHCFLEGVWLEGERVELGRGRGGGSRVEDDA